MPTPLADTVAFSIRTASGFESFRSPGDEPDPGAFGGEAALGEAWNGETAADGEDAWNGEADESAVVISAPPRDSQRAPARTH